MSEEQAFTSKETPAAKPSSGILFKASQLNFSLPTEIHEEIKQHLEHAKAKEDAAHQKVEELLEKEKKLEDDRKRMDEDAVQFRAQLQSQVDALLKRFQGEREAAKTEMGALKQEMAVLQKECAGLRNIREQTLEKFQNDKSKMEKEFLERESFFKEKLDLLTKKLTSLTHDEGELLKRKKSDFERSKKKEENLQKTLSEQMKLGQEVESAHRDLENSRKKQKAQLDKQYKVKVLELQKSFKDRSEYHVRREEEFDEEQSRLDQEREKIKSMEQSLKMESQRKTDEKFKSNHAELEKLEKQILKNQAALTKEEDAFHVEKKRFALAMKAPKGSKYAVAQLVFMVEEEEKVIKRKKKFLKSLAAYKTEVDEKYAEKVKHYDNETKHALAKLEDEKKNLLKLREALRAKQKSLLERETRELNLLNEQFEDLRTSLEVDQIEKDSDLDEKRAKIREEERKIREKQTSLQQLEKDASQRIETRESQLIRELEDIQKFRETILAQQDEMNASMKDFHATYQQRLEQQNSSLENFRETMRSLKNEAETLNKALAHQEKKLREKTTAGELAMTKRLIEQESTIKGLESELRLRMDDYQLHMNDLHKLKKDLLDKDRDRESQVTDNLSQYENKLFNIGKAFEDLSTVFNKQKESGGITIVPEDADQQKYKTRITKDGDVAKLEWPIAVKYRQDPGSMEIDDAMIVDYIEDAVAKWEEWIPVPYGKFWMGNKKMQNYAPYKQIQIEKPIVIGKYPVTSVQFYQFVHATNYKTDAESTVVGIVYHDGRKTIKDAAGKTLNHSYSNPNLAPTKNSCWLRPNGHPESLFEKYNHPITQVTWRDAMAYCRWKSEVLGKTVRLPTESEWEYVARNFGDSGLEELGWGLEEMKKAYNVEETGIGDTTAVNHFPENDITGGAQDLFGNVYEWVLDSRDSGGPASALEYKMVRGGSFITQHNQIAPWRRLSFVVNYCTSFLGFRVVCEDF